MERTFTVLISEANEMSWPDVIWLDAREAGAKIYLDYCCKMNIRLKQLRKIHFSNLTNRMFWLPMKCLWDWTNIVRPEELDPLKRNYIIFQTGVKFSAHYIKRLKEQHNACIVLYMPDNIRTMGIAKTKTEFERFCRHYHIDQVYSFAPNDCRNFGVEFFDYYSKLPVKTISLHRQDGKLNVLYVGGCRSRERLNILHSLYDKLKDIACCTFYLNGVQAADMTREGIYYNQPLTYKRVVELVQQNDVIVEIMNGQQTGNTLRLKEAVCYNKLLLTNNKTISSSHYYNSRYMQIFDQIEDIDLTMFDRDVNYNYQGEFSPKLLMEKILEKDIIYTKNNI